MTTTLVRRLTPEDIAAMTVEERIDLMELLWDSLDPEDIDLPESHDAEIKRRLETYEADKSSAVPWETVREEILRDLK